jgi:hypothetical protein
MKYFYLYIFILFSFILFISYYKFKEGFESNKKTYILVGDSILKNNAYVSNEKSIENILFNENQNIHCYAEDHSKIVDIYYQVNKIPDELNSHNTFIFVSAGGNNILSHYVDQNQDITNTSVLEKMFSSYINLIKSIQEKLPKAKIVLLDIYYPINITYRQYYNIIKEWNEMIYDFAGNLKNKVYSVMRVSRHLTQDEDFSFGIEPSYIGGKKIADLILQNY